MPRTKKVKKPTSIDVLDNKVCLSGPGVKLNLIPPEDVKALGISAVVGPVGEPCTETDCVLMFKSPQLAADFWSRSFYADREGALPYIEELDGYDVDWGGDVLAQHAAALSAITEVSTRKKPQRKKGGLIR